jgi:hypothetical protein
MCVICDGLSQDEALFDLDFTIARHGWALQIVEPGPGDPGWTYTIGLTDFGHPELVMVGLASDAGAVLNGLGERVRRGERFAVGDSTEAAGARVVVGEVHPAQVEDGLVDSWFAHYEAPGRPPPDLGVLQVSFTDCECRACGLRLDTPTWVLGGLAHNAPRTRPNRAIRRAGAQARARRSRGTGTRGFRPREP